MELKIARLTLLIDPNKKAAFERLCARQDRTASQVVRHLIRDHLAQHGVQYAASGLTADEFQPADEVAPPRTKPRSKRATPPPAKRRTGRRRA